MSWRVVLFTGCLAAVSAQGLMAEAPSCNLSAGQWVQEQNRKCPVRIQQWFEILDKEELFDKKLPIGASVKAEEFIDGAKDIDREPLPGPPTGYQEGTLGKIRIGKNECCLVSCVKPGKYPERRSVLYLRRGLQWNKLLQNEGTVDDVEGIEFIRISPRHDPLVVLTNFGGGSGIGRTLYFIGENGRIRRLLNLGNWNEGGYILRDFDGDGVCELVLRSRIWHPASLKARLSKAGDYDLVNPILYKDSIYRWRIDHFEVLGTRFWIDE